MKLNQNIFLLGIISLLVFSCKTKVPQTSVDTIKFEDSEVIKIEEIEIDTVKIEEIVQDTVVIEEIKTKKEYNVAVILPFMEDSVRNSWNETKLNKFEDFVFLNEAEKAISFLEGMLMAFNDIKFNSKFNIKVYDTQNDYYKTQSIVNQLKKDEIDVIIGPYSRENLLEVSKYAATNEITHFSPFSPSKTASLGNSKYYMIEPSLEQHIVSMINYSLDSIENAHFKFIYHNSTSGKSYASLVQNYFDTLNIDKDFENKINYSLLEISNDDNSSFSLSKNLDEHANNIIIVNSFNEDFIHLFLRQATSLDKKINCTYFGMPGWENSEIIRLGYLNSLNVHFTGATWIDEDNFNTIAFNKQYKEKYKSNPNETSYLGYDIVALFLKIINDNGLNFNNKVLGYTFKGLSRNFLFQQVLSSDNKVHRIENTELHIYKIDDFEKVLVK